MSLCLLWLPSVVSAQEPPLWPGAKYDPAIPTLKSGARPRSRRGDHAARRRRAVPAGAAEGGADDDAAVRIRAHLGRPAAVAVRDRQPRAHREARSGEGATCSGFADPRGTSRRPTPIASSRELPVVVWLSHGVHGNEISSADAALLEAYHLLAVAGRRRRRRRAARRARADRSDAEPRRPRPVRLPEPAGPRGGRPIPTPYNAEHDEPWPGGRIESLPVRHEPRLVRADAARDARPHQDRPRVSSRRSPSICTSRAATTPITSRRRPIRSTRTSPRARSPALDLFGRANAARFDERGWPYFIREVYDAFYPGYGESWPIFQGSIGMTYEQASARGLSFARSDGDDADLSRRRDAPLQRRDRHRDHRGAEPRAAGARLPRVPAQRGRRRREGADPRVRARARPRSVARRRAGANLATQGIEVRRAEEPIKVGDRASSRPAPTSCRTRSRPAA